MKKSLIALALVSAFAAPAFARAASILDGRNCVSSGSERY